MIVILLADILCDRWSSFYKHSKFVHISKWCEWMLCPMWRNRLLSFNLVLELTFLAAFVGSSDWLGRNAYIVCQLWALCKFFEFLIFFYTLALCCIFFFLTYFHSVLLSDQLNRWFCVNCNEQQKNVLSNNTLVGRMKRTFAFISLHWLQMHIVSEMNTQQVSSKVKCGKATLQNRTQYENGKKKYHWKFGW